MAEIIRQFQKNYHPVGLNIIINISLILISLQITFNTNKLSDGLILLGYGFIAACFYYFNIYNAESP